MSENLRKKLHSKYGVVVGKRDDSERQIANSNEIAAFLHCKRCLSEIPEGISPRDWAQLEVGWTPIGLQVWCRRHECNIVHIDFEGKQHPANLSAPTH